MAEQKHIAEKLVKVMASCRYIQKDRRNDFLRYSYASAAAVLERVNAACVEQNLAVVVTPRVISQTEKTNRSGAIETLVTVQTDVTLIDAESGESLTFTGLGSGQDVGDKAVAKAQTMALKYAWMTTLNIATGDDPEADVLVDELEEAQEVARQPQKVETRKVESQKADVARPRNLKAEKCPECGSRAALTETEEVVGKVVGIYHCTNEKCALKNFRMPIKASA